MSLPLQGDVLHDDFSTKHNGDYVCVDIEAGLTGNFHTRYPSCRLLGHTERTVVWSSLTVAVALTAWGLAESVAGRPV